MRSALRIFVLVRVNVALASGGWRSSPWRLSGADREGADDYAPCKQAEGYVRACHSPGDVSHSTVTAHAGLLAFLKS
jgi:hypothetical protein